MGSNPIRVVEIYIIYGILAQLGEHLPYKQRVIGSSPIGPIITVLYFPVKAADSYLYFKNGEMAQLARASGSYPGG